MLLARAPDPVQKTIEVQSKTKHEPDENKLERRIINTCDHYLTLYII